MYWILWRYGAAPDRQLGQESEKAIVHGIGIAQIIENFSFTTGTFVFYVV